MEALLANLTLLSRERQGLQCAGRVWKCDGFRFLMPIANLFNLGTIDSTEERSFFLAEIEPIYGWVGLRKKETKLGMFTTARFCVATPEAYASGVKINRVIELNCSDDVGVPMLSFLIIFEAPSQAWSRLSSWRYAFAMTMICGIKTDGDETQVAYESRWRLALSNDRQILEVTSDENARALMAEGAMDTQCLDVKLETPKTLAEVISDDVRIETRFTSLPFHVSDILRDPQARARVDKSYADETVRYARAHANSNDVSFFVLVSSFPTSTTTSSPISSLRAVSELVCCDIFREQLALDTRHSDYVQPREHVKAGSARGTAYFGRWLDYVLERCDLDCDCVDAIFEPL